MELKRSARQARHSLGRLALVGKVAALDRTVSAVTRFRSRVFGAPVSCANHLGLTTHVPVRQVYLTSGASRELRLGKQVTLFPLRHALGARA